MALGEGEKAPTGDITETQIITKIKKGRRKEVVGNFAPDAKDQDAGEDVHFVENMAVKEKKQKM